jgi:hypothetical protein
MGILSGSENTNRTLRSHKMFLACMRSPGKDETGFVATAQKRKKLLR